MKRGGWIAGLGEVELLDPKVPRGGELERARKMGGGLGGWLAFCYCPNRVQSLAMGGLGERILGSGNKTAEAGGHSCRWNSPASKWTGAKP